VQPQLWGGKICPFNFSRDGGGNRTTASGQPIHLVQERTHEGNCVGYAFVPSDLKQPLLAKKENHKPLCGGVSSFTAGFWRPFGNKGRIMGWVDTSACNFRGTPQYVSSLQGSDSAVDGKLSLFGVLAGNTVIGQVGGCTC
jgi:hypothetical protein